ncbi:restriction endonuclease subunit S [Burkholderia sp. Bp9131]|uniref:restriction endonuclease subunit S n=1 Tax=Burkholderia sp. Bp9131 TaxID=2184571 RepID=UPI000F578E32|nr:restriction endonuclease subunit S [Burkholderia sp. Bp9131]RQR37438.1 restriction endonuclease subunit S [Burkholderia sp. Bp9131]
MNAILTPLEDVCISINSGGTPSRQQASYWDGGTIPWIKTGELNDWKVQSIGEKISEEGLKNSSAKIYAPGTVLIAMYGDGKTITTMGIVDKPSATNQACCALVADPRICDPLYLFYALKERRSGLLNLVVAGAQRNLSVGTIKKFPILLHPYETQRRIAGILGAYDDLIEANRRRIAVLEEMARGLFTEWFTRLRFPGHEDVAMEDTPEGPLPAGWVIATLGELCPGKSGIQTGPFGSQLHQEDYADEGVPVVMPKNIIGLRIETDGIARIPPAIANSLGRHLMVEGDVVYGRRGDIGRRALISRAEAGFFCGTGCLRLRPDKNKTVPRYLFMALGTPETEGAIKARATGATMPNLNVGVMQDVPVLNPPVAMQRKFDAIIGPIQETITNLVSSNANLAAARDLLLPRLISGQLSVAQTKRELETA